MNADPLDKYPPLMSPREVSEFTGISVERLSGWRKSSQGPVYVKMGTGPNGSVRYPREDLRAFLAANTVRPAVAS